MNLVRTRLEVRPYQRAYAVLLEGNFEDARPFWCDLCGFSV